MSRRVREIDRFFKVGRFLFLFPDSKDPDIILAHSSWKRD